MCLLLRRPGLTKRQEVDIYHLMKGVGVLSNEDDDFKQMAIKTSNEQTQLGDLYSSQRSYDKAIQHCARAWKTGGLKYTQVTLFHQGVSCLPFHLRSIAANCFNQKRTSIDGNCFGRARVEPSCLNINPACRGSPHGPADRRGSLSAPWHRPQRARTPSRRLCLRTF